MAARRGGLWPASAGTSGGKARKQKAAAFCKFSALLFPMRHAPKMPPYICHLLFFQQCSLPFFSGLGLELGLWLRLGLGLGL